MTSYRKSADALRFAIAAGYRSVADAVTWADQIIAADPAPPGEIIDVALGERLDRSRIAELLMAVPGESRPVEVAREVLRQLHDELNEDRLTADAIATLVYNMAALGYLPEGEFGFEPWALSDSFELAMTGIYGTYEDARARLASYLAEHAARPPA
ncbi:MAG: hypothetical protein OEW06_03955 [Gemmatimonadota bacterium]|nr:hypothetical protein [Gemmatimonadota bacterium]